jgi:hypothetical protein
MSLLAKALYGFPPGSVVTADMAADRKACLEADPRYSTEAIRSFRGRIDKAAERPTPTPPPGPPGKRGHEETGA